MNQIQLNRKALAKTESDIFVLGESKTESTQKEIDSLKNKLSFTSELDFVPEMSGKTYIIAVQEKAIKDKFEGTAIEDVNLPHVEVSVNKITNDSLCVSNEAVAGSAVECLKVDDTKIGIVYRVPVPAAVKIVAVSKLPNDRKEIKVILEDIKQIPQIGPLASLRLDNDAFDDNAIEVAFSGSTGSPIKVAFKAKSKAENLSLTTSGISETYLKLKQDKNDDMLKANEQYITQKKAEVALESSISDLNIKNNDYLNKSALDEANLQKDLIQSQLALMREQQRMDAVKTGTATAAELELEAMKNQEQILIQKLNILKLQKEIEALQNDGN